MTIKVTAMGADLGVSHTRSIKITAIVGTDLKTAIPGTNNSLIKLLCFAKIAKIRAITKDMAKDIMLLSIVFPYATQKVLLENTSPNLPKVSQGEGTT